MEDRMHCRSRGFGELRLGWLEAFVAVAKCHGYENASSIVGLNASQVQRNVEDLQKWLRKILVFGAVPLEISVDGKAFLPIAIDILKMFSDQSDGADAASRPYGLNLKKSDKSLLSVSQAFAGWLVAKRLSLQRAGKKAEDYAAVRRGLKAVERALGTKIVSGHSRLNLLPAGQKFVGHAKELGRMLTSSRAHFLPRAEVEKQYLQRLRYKLAARRTYMRIFIRACDEAPRLTEQNLADRAKATRFVEEIDRFDAWCTGRYGPRPSLAGVAVPGHQA